jgi:hypothetical protein
MLKNTSKFQKKNKNNNLFLAFLTFFWVPCELLAQPYVFGCLSARL